MKLICVHGNALTHLYSPGKQRHIDLLNWIPIRVDRVLFCVVVADIFFSTFEEAEGKKIYLKMFYFARGNSKNKNHVES